MKTKSLLMLSLLFLLLFFTGCMTLIRTDYQKVPVTSVPPGAVVTATSNDADVKASRDSTPVTFKLERACHYKITISKPGYDSVIVQLDPSLNTGYSLLSQAFGFYIGASIDAASGANYTLLPKRVSVILLPPSTDSLAEIKPDTPVPRKAMYMINVPARKNIVNPIITYTVSVSPEIMERAHSVVVCQLFPSGKGYTEGYNFFQSYRLDDTDNFYVGTKIVSKYLPSKGGLILLKFKDRFDHDLGNSRLELRDFKDFTTLNLIMEQEP